MLSRTIRHATIALVVSTVLVQTTAFASETSSTSPAFGSWGVETNYISKELNPGDDFYRYVNQGWLKSAKIPAGYPMMGSFIRLMLETERQVQAIVDEAKSKPAPKGSPAQQLSDLHASFLNVAKRNTIGISKLQPEIDVILKIKTHKDLSRRMGRVGYSSVVGLTVEPDAKQPSRYILSLIQSGLGLPRDFYLQAAEPYAGFRLAYQDYIEGVFTRAKIGNAKQRAKDVLEFEKKLAEKQWAPADLRDAVKTYRPINISQLHKFAPGIDWPVFFKESGVGSVKKINLASDTSIQSGAKLFSETSVEVLRSYLAFHYLNSKAGLLSQEWADAKFEFYAHRLSGIKEQRPLDKQALDLLSSRTGEQIGRLYAQKFFPQESKEKIDKLVKFLRLALRERLEHSDWMDEPTKTAAIAKLQAITTKIGYPDRWHDFSSIRIEPDDLVGNIQRIEEWQTKDAIAKLREPVRKWEWSPQVMPHVINAYYNPAGNEIVFPAAILQAPFFDPKADPAVNFGAIGMVIGHEISHGFDDQGSSYDGQGVLRNWWTDKSKKAFEQRSKGLVAEYDRFSPLPGLNLNGHLTLGENIGDLGGISIAWSGYQNFIADEYQGKPPVIDGFTGNQRFFLGYAQLWRTLTTEGFTRQTTLTDPHSPGEFRVNGILKNFTPWYETFGVRPNDKLYLPTEQRVSIW